MAKKAELVFIPFPGLSHLISTVEGAKLLLRRDHRLSATVLTMKIANERLLDGYMQKVSSDPDTPSTLRFIALPGQEQTPGAGNSFEYISSLKESVREVVSDLIKRGTTPVAGLVLGMFCTLFAEVAEELNLPVYVFFTSGACALGLLTHLVRQFHGGLDLTQFRGSDAELPVPCFSIPVPAKVFPRVLVESNPFSEFVISSFRRIPSCRGILTNTFRELESFAIESMVADEKMPEIYPVGPILNLADDEGSRGKAAEIKEWLDDQPETSVVFLCFGSMGSFQKPQVAEIAAALESSGSRFLWSLRKPPESIALQFTSEYESFEEVLPEGFLDRTKGIGKVIGWAPQTAVLAHPAVGGFVSHCGWNSTLESVWFGVPVATFPLSAEQQTNAFHLARELKMAEEITIDYSVGYGGGDTPPDIVSAEKIAAAIRKLMAGGEVREKVKEMQSSSRSALQEGGSSCNALGLFIHHVFSNIP